MAFLARLLRLGCASALLLCLQEPAFGQFSQYVAPGQFEPRSEPIEQQLEAAMEQAAWRYGRWFADPWVGVRNIAHQDNLGSSAGEEPFSDLTVTVGAGLRAYRPIGGDLTLALHALPEYVWWQDLTERRRFNGRYGAGLFGNFGRIGLELSGQLLEDSQLFSREVEEQVNTSEELSRLALEVDLGRGAALFAEAEVRMWSFESEEGQQLPAVSLLDREETLTRAGLRYSFTDAVTIGAGAQSYETRFDDAGAGTDPSNSGSGPFVSLSVDRERLFLAADLAQLDLTADRGTAFAAFDETTGRAVATFRMRAPVEVELFGDRNLVYSINPDYAYFLDSRAGVGLRVSLNSRVGFRGFVEEGTNEYQLLPSGGQERTDDVAASGVSLSFRLGRTQLAIGSSVSEYTSNIPDFSREVRRFTTSLTLAGGGSSPWG